MPIAGSSFLVDRAAHCLTLSQELMLSQIEARTGNYIERTLSSCFCKKVPEQVSPAALSFGVLAALILCCFNSSSFSPVPLIRFFIALFQAGVH